MSGINKPMNPYAKEDFKSAILNATERLNKQAEELHNKFESIGFINLDPMDEPYCGKMRLNYLNGLGGWQDVLTVLIAHGYEVTARKESATDGLLVEVIPSAERRLIYQLGRAWRNVRKAE